jgi:hypothetical protein
MDKSITFQVDSEIADAFEQASSSQKQVIQSVISLWLKQMVQPESLEAITQEIRQESATKGLTPSILADLLSDD